MNRIVVGIPYEDPSDILCGGTRPPQFSPIQIFEVAESEDPRDVLKKRVEPPQHVWTHAGTLSSRAQAYYVERLGKDVPSELPEAELTSQEMSEIQKIKDKLQYLISVDAQREFDSTHRW